MLVSTFVLGANSESLFIQSNQATFKRFPRRTLLESGAVPIEVIAELSLREGQSSNPLFRVHRWFARRLGSQFRSILAALSIKDSEPSSFWDVYFGEIDLKGAVVLDPFVGGGTSLIEASRCGARVIGYDIDPVATFITRFELGAISFDGIPKAVKGLCESFAKTIRPFHKTQLPDGRIVDVLHHFWVEVKSCDHCGRSFEVHPHFRLAYNKTKELQWAFCKSCHKVHELPLSQESLTCACEVITRIEQGSLYEGKITCSLCGKDQHHSSKSSPSLIPPKYKLFAQEYLDRSEKRIIRKFKPASDEDRALYTKASRTLSRFQTKYGRFVPERPIPTQGRSDQRPLIHGFTHYHQLFNARQRLHLCLLAKAILNVPIEIERRLLALAFSEHLATNCMYTSYAFGYRRTSPLFSIHSYRHITRPVEINPWLENIGRGTFLNALNKIEKAITFAKEPSDLDPKGGKRSSKQTVGARNSTISNSPATLFNSNLQAVVKTASSTALLEIPDGSIDLILTDPPYFDNLSYSELSDFYLAWQQILRVAEKPYRNPNRPAPIKKSLAVTSKSKSATDLYCKELSQIFAECKRVLKADGLCVFTYHHRSPEAWFSLGYALAKSNLTCTAVLPMRGEGQGGLHSYEGTLKWDAVFVCRNPKTGSLSSADSIVVAEKSVLKAEKVAAGYNTRLGAIERIGFKAADHLNLFRALVVAAAKPGVPRRGVKLLSEVLAVDRRR